MDYHEKEALKQKVMFGGAGVFAGGVAWWIVLAAVLGWVSPTVAQKQASHAAQVKVDQVLAPFCANRFMANKKALAKFIKASAGYDRNEIVQNAIPKIGPTSVDYRLSGNCATDVAARIKTTARSVMLNAAKKS